MNRINKVNQLGNRHPLVGSYNLSVELMKLN